VKQLNVLLLGDICTDVYVYGHVNRISPEAPVPIFEYSHKESKLGMSGNVFENLLALDCNVTRICGNSESTKTRFIDNRTGQQLLRMDEDFISKPIELSEELFEQNFDCVVISDYNKGSITNDVFDRLLTIYHGPIFVDTKKTDLSHLDMIYPPSQIYIKINELEYSKLQYKNARNLIVTLGKDGARYKDKTYTTPKVNVSDVCGAGDTHLSALAYMFCQTRDIERSILWANRAASVTVQHLGVYAPTLEEINAT
jgi:D-beta-D-heptose 7-phosphate kinase/D-beta-D-heptose 1-phosphate adenosyltransferase